MVRCSRLSDLKGQSGLTLGVVVRCSRLLDLRLKVNDSSTVVGVLSV